MPAPGLGTIDNDLDSQILNRDKEKQVANTLRLNRRPPDDSVDKLISLASGGIGMDTGETDAEKQAKKKDPSTSSGQAPSTSSPQQGSGQAGQDPSTGSGQAPSSRSAGSGQDSSGFDSRLARAPSKGEEQDEDKQKGEKAEEGPSSRSAGSGQAEGEEGEKKEEQGPPSIRQKLAQARQAANLKKRAKDKLEEKITAPVNKGTKRLLKGAWQSMPSVINFVPALFYVNLHVFLRCVVGDKFFCKLGEEWVPEQAKAIIGETPNKTFGTIEIIILLILDTITFVIIGAVLTLLVMIANFITASWGGKAKIILDLGWDGIKALIALF